MLQILKKQEDSDMKVTWQVKGNKITFEITTAKVEQKPTEGYFIMSDFTPDNDANPASNVCEELHIEDYFFELSRTVPLVVRYE